MKGIKEGETRSGLYYEGYKILKESLKKEEMLNHYRNHQTYSLFCL